MEGGGGAKRGVTGGERRKKLMQCAEKKRRSKGFVRLIVFCQAGPFFLQDKSVNSFRVSLCFFLMCEFKHGFYMILLQNQNKT